MNHVYFDPERLVDVFRRQTIAKMPELKAALGSTVDLTVFRKLAELDYRSSYSHRGAYYVLDAMARFDAHGLWSHTPHLLLENLNSFLRRCVSAASRLP